MIVRLNEQPVTDTVRDVLLLDGALSPAVAVRPVQPVMNAPGVFGSGTSRQPRTITIGLDVWPDAMPERETMIDALRHRLGGLLLLTTDAAPTREWWCVCTAVDVQLYQDAWAILRCYVAVTLTAADPARYERDPVPLGLSTARTTCGIGTQPVAPRVWLYGASPSVVDPVIIVRNAQGDETHRLTLSVTLATNDALDIQCATQRVDRYVGGVLQTGTSSGDACVLSGDFPILDPDDAIRGDGITLELSATSGTPTGLALLRRGF